MLPLSLLLVLPCHVVDGPVETRFFQVAPVVREGSDPLRSPGQERAVMLVHGVTFVSFKKDAVTRPFLREWQKRGSVLVTRLMKEADVYAFAYSQTAPADEVADAPALGAA